MTGFIKHLLTVFLLALLSSVALGADQAKTKILFIGKNPDHPYGSHMYMHVGAMLAKCVELTPGMETVVSNGWPQDAKAVAGVKSIVVYTSPGAEFLLDGPERGTVDELMKQGVGLVTIHWASSVKKEDLERLGPTWLGYLGGTWVRAMSASATTALAAQAVAAPSIRFAVAGKSMKSTTSFISNRWSSKPSRCCK